MFISLVVSVIDIVGMFTGKELFRKLRGATLRALGGLN